MSKKPTKAQAKKRILNQYKKFVLKKGRHPNRPEMLELGVSRDQIRHHYGSITNLKEVAKQEFPSVFEDIIDYSYFTEERVQDLLKDIKKHKRFVITTAVVGCDIHKKFLGAVQNYCKRNKALLLVLPSADPAKSSDWILDRAIAENKIHIVFKDVSLNSNFFLSSIKTSAKQIKPLTGLQKIGSRNGSFVFASPKQDLEYVAIANTKFPHAMMTPGAITVPDYQTDRYMSERTSYLATEDHVMGALVVEIENDKEYHFRQIQAEPSSGAFVDLGTYYKADGSVEKMNAEAFVLGDLHAGETDPKALKAWKEVIKHTGVKDLVIHDGFNGNSINHHEVDQLVRMSQKYRENKLSLIEEGRITAQSADYLLSLIPGKLIWVMSNHDEFLHRLLQSGRFIKDAINFPVCASLVRPMFDGKNPLKVLMETDGGLKGKDRIVWLSRNDDFKIAGHQCGAHGDKGANGKRGPGLEELAKSYGSCITGHAHTPGIRGLAFRVGTSSLLRLSYNDGPSSWMHCSCLVYPNGARQLINSIEGKWRLKK